MTSHLNLIKGTQPLIHLACMQTKGMFSQQAKFACLHLHTGHNPQLAWLYMVRFHAKVVYKTIVDRFHFGFMSSQSLFCLPRHIREGRRLQLGTKAANWSQQLPPEKANGGKVPVGPKLASWNPQASHLLSTTKPLKLENSLNFV